MIQFQENNPTEAGWKDGRTQFRGTLLATARGLTSTTAVKFKDTEYDVGLTKNYCLTVSMQKNS